MLGIKVPKDLCDNKEFCEYLLDKLINNVTYSVHSAKYDGMNEVINNYIGNKDCKYSCDSLITYYVRTFTITDEGDYFLIGDNSRNEYISRDSGIKLNTIVRLIEYGAIGVPPVPRLTSCINDISNNLYGLCDNWNRLRSGN